MHTGVESSGCKMNAHNMFMNITIDTGADEPINAA